MLLGMTPKPKPYVDPDLLDHLYAAFAVPRTANVKPETPPHELAALVHQNRGALAVIDYLERLVREQEDEQEE